MRIEQTAAIHQILICWIANIRRPSSAVVHTFKHEYFYGHSWSVLMKMYVASLGRGNAVGQNRIKTDFHGNQNLLETFKKEKVHFSRVGLFALELSPLSAEKLST